MAFSKHSLTDRLIKQLRQRADLQSVGACSFEELLGHSQHVALSLFASIVAVQQHDAATGVDELTDDVCGIGERGMGIAAIDRPPAHMSTASPQREEGPRRDSS